MQPKIHLIMIFDLLITSGLFLVQSFFCNQSELCERSLCGARWIDIFATPFLYGYLISQFVIISHQNRTLRAELKEQHNLLIEHRFPRAIKLRTAILSVPEQI